jgi:hypothetical protein
MSCMFCTGLFTNNKTSTSNNNNNTSDNNNNNNNNIDKNIKTKDKVFIRGLSDHLNCKCLYLKLINNNNNNNKNAFCFYYSSKLLCFSCLFCFLK